MTGHLQRSLWRGNCRVFTSRYVTKFRYSKLRRKKPYKSLTNHIETSLLCVKIQFRLGVTAKVAMNKNDSDASERPIQS